MKNFKYISLLFILLICFSCGKDSSVNDTTKPTLLINQPTNNSSIAIGEKLNVNFNIADDIELMEYAVIISSHNVKSGVKGIELFSFNSFVDTDANGNKTPDVRGKKEANVKFDIAIPTTARAGNYILTISVKDFSNNSTSQSHQLQIVR